MAAADKDDAPSALEEGLHNVINALSVLDVMVSDFYQVNETNVWERLNDFVAKLETVDNLSSHTTAVVPKSLVGHISKPRGNNPDLYLKARLDEVIKLRVEGNKQISQLRDYRDELARIAADAAGGPSS